MKETCKKKKLQAVPCRLSTLQGKLDASFTEPNLDSMLCGGGGCTFRPLERLSDAPSVRQLFGGTVTDRLVFFTVVARRWLVCLRSRLLSLIERTCTIHSDPFATITVAA